MKLITFFVILTTFFFAPQSAPAASRADKNPANEVLKKTADKLAGLKSVRYVYRRELNYSSEGFFHTTTADAFFDFTSIDKVLGLKYQFGNEGSFAAFNGTESFTLNKKSKTISVENKPTAEYLGSFAFLINSLLTLKNVLPRIISDDTIPKTLIKNAGKNPKYNDNDYYVVEFTLNKKTLDALGNYFPITQERKFTYRLIINKTDFLPIEVTQENNVNKDFIKTNFSNIETNPAPPPDKSWYFSTYLNEYKYEKPPEDLLIKIGQTAPDWKLPVTETGAQTSLSEHKNKVVMLEFWISFCGYCIAAVPRLNAIEEKFKGGNFKLIGINAHDSAEIIKLFKKNHQPQFEILHGGEEVAKSYGVSGFPTIVLIDKSGKVIYSGSFEADKIEEIISKNL